MPCMRISSLCARCFAVSLLLKKLAAQAVQAPQGFVYHAGELVAAPAIGAGVFRYQGSEGGGKLGRVEVVKFPGGQGQGWMGS